MIRVKPNLYCLHYNECDPKKCTAIKLSRLNLLKNTKKLKGTLKKAILLNPLSRNIISYDDREAIRRNGLIVIDCSWKKIFNLKKYDIRTSRKLPPLISSNPVNYGQWEKLSSAEALASALYITGYKDYANLILSKFSWGIEFKKLNNFP